MRKMWFSPLMISAALFLLLLVSASTARGPQSFANAHASRPPVAQDPAMEQWPPVPQIQVDVQPPEIHVVPEIEPIEVKVDLQEIAREVAEHVGGEHEGFGSFDINVDHGDRDYKVRSDEKIEKSFTMPAAHRALEIDNVWGSIEVVGTDGTQAQLTVNKSIQAESQEKLEKARKEVTLDITNDEGSLKLYVNGPFRCQCHDCVSFHGDEGYVVKMDFQLRVPRDIDVKVKTVNEGRVVVHDINGDFLTRNVNGDIEMHNIAGSGTARTVNGPVKVSFRQNPREASDFQTVNGAVELRFATGLAADFRFKTFNGSIYSDFPVTALPVHAIQEERHGSKVVFRADRYTGVRVSSGGPEIKVENLNGDIRILENHE